MPLYVKLQEKLTDSVYRATGEFSGSKNVGNEVKEVKVDAEVLVRKEGNQLHLHLDDSIQPSTIDGVKVKEYQHAEPVEKSSIRVGVRVEFRNFWFKPENN